MDYSHPKVTIVTIMALLALAQTSLAQHIPNIPKPPLDANNLIHKFLVGQNAARAAVGVPPVTWNATVAAYAQAYAAQRSRDCRLEHSRGPYGENIAAGYGGEFPVVDAVAMWVGERPHYDYASNSCVGGQCLHYTQVVWRNTHSIGCAKVKCPNQGTFITCNYYPPGNYIGERPY